MYLYGCKINRLCKRKSNIVEKNFRNGIKLEKENNIFQN